MLAPSSSASFMVVLVRLPPAGPTDDEGNSLSEKNPFSRELASLLAPAAGAMQDNVQRTSATVDGGLLLQDAVERIADEGGCLEWVPASGPACDAHYVVLDGDLFEARFNAIRRRKRPRTGTSVARSFSGMSKHFVLLSGDGWARTGSRFRPKNLSAAASAPTTSAAGGRGAAAPTSSGSWFCKDVKYCYQCGHGSTKQREPHCGKCGCHRWTRAAGEAMSTVETFIGLLRQEASILNQVVIETANSFDDLIVTGSQQKALDALRTLVAAASAADGEESEQGGAGHRRSIWEFRGVHLGFGICQKKKLDDLLLAFIMWAEEPSASIHEAASFNVTKAMRRLSNFASFQEEHFERFFSEPLELADISRTGHACGEMMHIPLWVDSDGYRVCECTCTLPVTDNPRTDTTRQFMRYFFGLILCMSFDDVCVSNGVQWFEDMRSSLHNSLSNTTKMWAYFNMCNGALLTLLYRAAPIKQVASHLIVSPRVFWWCSWAQSILNFFLTSKNDGLLGMHVTQHSPLETSRDSQRHFGASHFAALIANSDGRCCVQGCGPPELNAIGSSDGCGDQCVLSGPIAAEGCIQSGNTDPWLAEDECGFTGDVAWVPIDPEQDDHAWSVLEHPEMESAPNLVLGTPAQVHQSVTDSSVTATRGPSAGGWQAEVEVANPAAKDFRQCKTLEKSEDRIFINDHLTEYVSKHMKITSSELKFNALSRVRDLHELFSQLEVSGVVEMFSQSPSNTTAGGVGGTDLSIFGFSRLLVHDIQKFNDGVKSMVVRDSARCWKVNGRLSLQQPTGPVYELLRQLGVHPVKGTCAWTSTGSRDLLCYSEYVFSFDRMLKNCSRLRIGAIGNRRSTG